MIKDVQATVTKVFFTADNFAQKAFVLRLLDKIIDQVLGGMPCPCRLFSGYPNKVNIASEGFITSNILVGFLHFHLSAQKAPARIFENLLDSAKIIFRENPADASINFGDELFFQTGLIGRASSGVVSDFGNGVENGHIFAGQSSRWLGDAVDAVFIHGNLAGKKTERGHQKKKREESIGNINTLFSLIPPRKERY